MLDHKFETLLLIHSILFVSWILGRSLNNAIHDFSKEITKFSNQVHSLKKCPFDAKSTEKSFQRIIKKLKEEKQNLVFELQQKLLEWERETLELISSIKGIAKRASADY